LNKAQENTTHCNNLHVIFNCITLAHDPHSSVSCPYLLNLGTVLSFVNYVGHCQATGTYCIGYCDYGFSVLCIFVNLCILNVCFSCLYCNYFNVFSHFFPLYYDPLHVNNSSANKCLLFKHLTFLHHASCIQ
jgi:hypothetical protein